MKQTLYDKILNDHCILDNDDHSSLIYIDRHLIHEVTSPQAFDGLEIKNRDIWNKKSIMAQQTIMFQLLIEIKESPTQFLKSR